MKMRRANSLGILRESLPQTSILLEFLRRAKDVDCGKKDTKIFKENITNTKLDWYQHNTMQFKENGIFQKIMFLMFLMFL